MLRIIIEKVLSFADSLAGDYYGKDQKSKPSTSSGHKQNTQNDFINEKARQQSMKASQGNSDFSGSGYNGPGNVDHEKRNSNMAQRNF